MKKVVISICAVAFVALTAINLNLTLNSDFKVNLSLASIVSLAKGENDGGVGFCKQYEYSRRVGNETQYFLECHFPGTDNYCTDGYMICNFGSGTCNCCPYENYTINVCLL